MASIVPTQKLKDAQLNNWVGDMIPNESRVRVEIEEFLADNDMTNLFLLALTEMQTENRDKAGENEDWWTFYSLSGIHGLPKERWAGVDKPADGYCTHGLLVFPTWHRVYIKAFEQAVANKMIDIANTYTDEKERALNLIAADRFRFPFWDPFLPRHKVVPTPKTNEERWKIWGFPEILAKESVYVKHPNDTELESIPNPLRQFNFPNNDLKRKGRELIPWNQITNAPGKGAKLAASGGIYTIRCPDEDGNTDIYGLNENRAGLQLKLQRQALNISSQLWKLLARYTPADSPSNKASNAAKGPAHDNRVRSWKSFATHWLVDSATGDWVPDPEDPDDFVYEGDTAVSLESWHDKIHTLVGTGGGFYGHMANPRYAGFDPIFWLHHCNIDRILAIYQALYPDKWLEDKNAKEDLLPFRKDKDNFWNSNDVKDWTKLGFAVPGSTLLDEDGVKHVETYLHNYYNWAANGDWSPPETVSKEWPRDLTSSIALYGPSAKPNKHPTANIAAVNNKGLFNRIINLPTADSLAITVNNEPKQVVISKGSSTDSGLPKETIDNGSTLTWNARIRVKKFAFNGSFNIHLFLGYIKDSQPERYITKKNEIGFSGVFANSDPSTCDNCIKQRNNGMIYEDAIPITPILADYLESNTAGPTDGPDPRYRVLKDYSPEQVVPFLTANLGWKLTDVASHLLDDEQQLKDSGLEIEVSVRKYDLPTAAAPLGVYHPATSYPAITAGKLGGSRSVVHA